PARANLPDARRRRRPAQRRFRELRAPHRSLPGLPRLRDGLPGGGPLRIAARICARDDPRTKDRSRLDTSKDSAQADVAPRLPLPEATEAGLRALALPARKPAYPIRLQKRLRALDRAEGRFRALAVDDDGARWGDVATGRRGDGATTR